MQMILTNSTTKAQLCIHPILVSVDEIKKEELASAGEKTQELSIVPPQSIELKSTMPMVVYQGKEKMSTHVSTLVSNFLVHLVSTIEKNGTPVQIGQEANPAPTKQAQGDTKIA